MAPQAIENVRQGCLLTVSTPEDKDVSRQQGLAVAGANLWISVPAPFLAPLVVTIPIFWVPFIAIAAVVAWIGMNDIADAKASFADLAVIFKRRHNWLMCWLYLGTFGSFIGCAAGFPLLIKSQFPQVNPLHLAWMGPLLGALVPGTSAAVRDQAIRDGNKEAATVLGFSGAIGAYGGSFIPKSHGTSIAATGAALHCFIVFYKPPAS